MTRLGSPYGVVLPLNAAPSGVIVPDFPGQQAIDLTTGNMYVSTGIAATDWVAAGGGGGGSLPDFTGAGSPSGVQVANVGQSYVDTTNGAWYWKVVGDGDNVGWVVTTGQLDQASLGEVGMFIFLGGGQKNLWMFGENSVHLSDLASFAGTGNGLEWHQNAGDGFQTLDLFLGSSSQFVHHWLADGSYHAPGAVYSKADAEPADGTLADGEFCFWLDDTNGASVFHIKAKSADGTVVQGQVALA